MEVAIARKLEDRLFGHQAKFAHNNWVITFLFIDVIFQISFNYAADHREKIEGPYCNW